MATLTITPIKTFVSGETVLPSTLNQLAQSTAALTAGTIVDADVSASAAIAASKLSTAAQQALLPAGAIMPFAMNSAPAGWLAADGTAVSRSTYAALFSAIGTTYGVGDGSTTFALPDLRGYFVRGSGTNSDGTAAGAFGTKQADDLKSHTHSYGDVRNSFTSQFSVVGGSGMDGATDTSRTTGATGGTETRPKNIAMLYCIKF
jgi:microcystin-dependent protein